MPKRPIIRRKTNSFEIYEIPSDDGGCLVIGAYEDDDSIWIHSGDPEFPITFKKPANGISPNGNIYYKLLDLWEFAQRHATVDREVTHAVQGSD